MGRQFNVKDFKGPGPLKRSKGLITDRRKVHAKKNKKI